ncbi:MAG: aromatic ring-hydroxylating dioxygenase subunit alpha [Actinomycetota bacterium]
MTATMETVRWFDNDDPSLRRCWHPVARIEDLDADGPLPVRLLGEDWCVVRLGGRLSAFVDRCPHRLAPLSAGSIVDDTLRCVYHGFRFDGDGSCVEIPAQDSTLPIPARASCDTAAHVAEHLGLIWIAPDEPLVGLPHVPEHDDPTFVSCPLPPSEWKASAGQMADNFLDPGHLAFLHLRTFATIEDTRIGDYDVERDGWSYSVRYRHQTQPLRGTGDESPGTVERESHWVFTAPHHVYLRLSYPSDGVVLTISFCHQPVDATTTRLFCTDYRNDIADDPAEIGDAVAFQLAVADEDRAVLELLRRKAVPLDPGVEFHSRADRITVELRRILAELAATVESSSTPSR